MTILDTDSVMLGMPTMTLKELVKPDEDSEMQWMLSEAMWFCDDPGDKTPGLLKVEEEATEGSFLALSPKCYIFGTKDRHKRLFFDLISSFSLFFDSDP